MSYRAGKPRATYLHGSNKVKPSAGDRYLAWLSWLLLGYALFGRGFAYLGVGPIYVGEITLAFGLLIWVLNRFCFEVFRLIPACLLAAFMFWNATQTVPYLTEYKVDAMRDAASWGYGFFALIVATLLIAKPDRLRFLLDRYGRFVVIFAIAAPAAWLLQLIYGQALPSVPGSATPLINPKAGDLLVHLAGSAAFLVSGLGGASLLVSIMLCINFPLFAFWNRGGMIAFLLSFALAGLLSPFKARAFYVLAIFVFAFGVLFATGAKVELPGLSEDLELSTEQLVLNLQSVVGEDATGTGRLDSTKQWRLEWWNEIVGYTFKGDYFWTGKGYGINLAEDDGFQNKRTEDDTPLRSPHSAHMTFLARSGVPGLVLWTALQVTWATWIFVNYLRSRRRRERRWTGTFLFLLAYWVAFMVNASFDVFLEGPMGGIWFWTLYGVGLGAVWIYQRYPEILENP